MLVVLHALKKQEFKLKYHLKQIGADWKVVDVEVLGESMLTASRFGFMGGFRLMPLGFL